MNVQAENAIRDVFAASLAGRMHFGEVVETLLGLGIESYHVDYRTLRSTYYARNDETLAMDLPPRHVPIADAFDKEALQAAIRGSQQGKVMYPEFKRLSQGAGCVGYVVWLSGRHVAYFGRRGEVHIEKFPD